MSSGKAELDDSNDGSAAESEDDKAGWLVRLKNGWDRLEQWLQTAHAFLISGAMYLLFVECTPEEIRKCRYGPSGGRVLRDEIEDSNVGADALLDLAKEVKSEAEDRFSSGRKKARVLLTFCGLLLAALSFSTRLSAPSMLLGVPAFLFVFLSILLLLCHFRVRNHRGLSLAEEDLGRENDSAFKRGYAADILSNTRVDDGVADFLTDIRRAATRALLIALVCTTLAACYGLVTTDGATSPHKESERARSQVEEGRDSEKMPGERSSPKDSSFSQ